VAPFRMFRVSVLSGFRGFRRVFRAPVPDVHLRRPLTPSAVAPPPTLARP
jgi:hypothetical protein